MRSNGGTDRVDCFGLLVFFLFLLWIFKIFHVVYIFVFNMLKNKKTYIHRRAIEPDPDT